jgi:hypothetical protein
LASEKRVSPSFFLLYYARRTQEEFSLRSQLIPPQLSHNNNDCKFIKKSGSKHPAHHHLERNFVIKIMHVFLSLLAPIFLFKSLASAQTEASLSSEGYSYSVSWGEDGNGCNVTEAMLSLDAIVAAVDIVLEQDDLQPVIDWETQVTHNGIRQLQDETRGMRGLCNWRCTYPQCLRSTCYIRSSCDECGYRRQLIQTERVLTARELKDLEDQLVTACEKALKHEGRRYGIGNPYSEDCRTAMIAATCSALVGV